MSAKKYLSNRKVGKNAQKAFQNGVESPLRYRTPTITEEQGVMTLLKARYHQNMHVPQSHGPANPVHGVDTCYGLEWKSRTTGSLNPP
jgi:hypothetical protein